MPPIPDRRVQVPQVPASPGDGEVVLAGKRFPAPFWRSAGGEATLYHGHVTEQLRLLPARSVHCVVTSPPYWGLRDYGTGDWQGGREDCDHLQPLTIPKTSTLKCDGRPAEQVGWNTADIGIATRQYGRVCKKCGALRVDDQIGCEPSPDCLGWATGKPCGKCFVCHITEMARELKRVLRDDGIFFLNLGDSYGSTKNTNGLDESTLNGGLDYGRSCAPEKPRDWMDSGVTSGNLVGVPWRVALALQADGWILRSSMPWVKPNAMPESALSRPGKSYEEVFMLTKRLDYFFDMEAVRQPNKSGEWDHSDGLKGKRLQADNRYEATAGQGFVNGASYNPEGRNFRNADLWFTSTGVVGIGDTIVGFEVPVSSYPGAHFAVFSERLITPMIQCGSSEHGCCAECGKPYERVIRKVGGEKAAPDLDGRDRSLPTNNNGVTGSLDGKRPTVETLGWRRGCHCATEDVEPCVVLDPFNGSGTTAATSILLGRRGMGIDLSDEYLRDNAIPRIELAVRGQKVTRKNINVLREGKPA